MSRAPSSMIAITTTIILNKKAITIGSQLLSVKGYVRYVQPRGLMLDNPILDTSVPARIIYSKPTMLRDAPVAEEEVGMIYDVISAMIATIMPSIPIVITKSSDPCIEIVSTLKLIIITKISTAMIILTNTISIIAASEFACRPI